MTIIESAASVRAFEAVSAFDATDHLSEHGLTVANLTALEAARGIVASAVAESLGKINDYLAGMRTIRQNPYRDVVKVGGKEVRFAALIDLFSADALKGRVEEAFASASERAGQLERPKLDVLSAKIASALGERLREPGFILAGSELHADGSLARIALRDPVYAEGAAKQRTVTSTGGDVAELDAAVRRSGQSLVPGDMGVTWANSADRFSEVQAFAEELVEQMAQSVSDHLRSTLAVGLSPFNRSPGRAYTAWCTPVDERYMVLRGRELWQYGRHAAVPVLADPEITRRLDERMGASVKVDPGTFQRYVIKRLAKRLKASPELRAANIEKWNAKVDEKDCYRNYVICVTELRAPEPPGTWRRLLAALRLRSLPAPAVLALPPPDPKPLALPAPKP